MTHKLTVEQLSNKYELRLARGIKQVLELITQPEIKVKTAREIQDLLFEIKLDLLTNK